MGQQIRGVTRCALTLGAWAVLFVHPGSVLADGVVRDGLGAISLARGGTNLAHADNGNILLDNPAALVNIAGQGLVELSVDLLITDLHYSDPQNRVAAEVKPYPMPQFAYILKGPHDQWAAGVGVYAPAGFGAEYDVVHPLLGLQRQKSFGALLKVLPGLAYRVTDRLAVGGTVGLGVTHAELEGPFHLQSGPLPGAPALLDLQATGAAVAWSVGLQYQLSPCTSLGLAYTGQTRFQLEGNAAATVPGLGQSTFDAEVDLVWPRSLGLGITHWLCDHHRISMDVIWYDWSHAFDHVDMRMTNASQPLFALLLGPVFADRFPLDWQDSISVRLGYEHFLTPNHIFRAGYVYHRNPIPETTLTPFIPGILEHAFAVGYGTCCFNWNLDLAYQFSFGRPRNVTRSAILGGDYDLSRMEAQAHWIAISLSRQF